MFRPRYPWVAVLLMAALAPLASARPSAAQDLYLFGHDNSQSSTVRIDTATGAASLVGPIGFDSESSGLATSRAPFPAPGGRIYPTGTHVALLQDRTRSTDVVTVIDTVTGHGTQIVETSERIDTRGVAFGPDGHSLYVLDTSGLFATIDTVDGSVEPIGLVRDQYSMVHRAGNLDWSPEHHAFIALAKGTSSVLITIDPHTGDATRIATLPSVKACTLARSPGPVQGPGGTTLPEGTWFAVDWANGWRVITFTFDVDAATASVTRTIGRTSRDGLSGRVCGMAFAEARRLPTPATVTATRTAPPPTATDTPSATVTATPSPTPTVTPSPSDTATPVPSATSTAFPTASATPDPSVAFLPWLGAPFCSPIARPLDVILVLDSSFSMTRMGPDGQTRKLEAAKRAALRFTEMLALPSDRVAVIGFNYRADVAHLLSDDRTGVPTAIRSIRAATGTRIDAGLEAASTVLDMGGRTSAKPVVVLLTDGHPERSTEAAVIRAAERLIGRGAALFTIGLGAQVNGSLLRRIASRSENYLPSPTAAGLEDAYRSVIELLPCE